MGLFGSLKKIAGGVLKAGLSVATRGVSDKVLSALKGLGKKRATVAAKPLELTEQNYALVNKLGQATPKVKVTEVLAQARSGGAMRGTYKAKASYKRKRRMSEPAAPRTTTARTKRYQPGTRRPPPGGLDLKAMAAQWRGAGKPGRWIDWIKANPIRRA